MKLSKYMAKQLTPVHIKGIEFVEKKLKHEAREIRRRPLAGGMAFTFEFMPLADAEWRENIKKLDSLAQEFSNRFQKRHARPQIAALYEEHNIYEERLKVYVRKQCDGCRAFTRRMEALHEASAELTEKVNAIKLPDHLTQRFITLSGYFYYYHGAWKSNRKALLPYRIERVLFTVYDAELMARRVAELSTCDWRPTETLPEDYYSL